MQSKVLIGGNIIFSNFLKFGTFPDDWKKGNAVPVHKKDNKQIVDNYHPVSLLPICSNVFEKLAFDAIFEFMIDKNLLSINQSGFRPNDSCVNQLFFFNFFSINTQWVETY